MIYHTNIQHKKTNLSYLALFVRLGPAIFSQLLTWPAWYNQQGIEHFLAKHCVPDGGFSADGVHNNPVFCFQYTPSYLEYLEAMERFIGLAFPVFFITPSPSVGYIATSSSEKSLRNSSR